MCHNCTFVVIRCRTTQGPEKKHQAHEILVLVTKTKNNMYCDKQTNGNRFQEYTTQLSMEFQKLVKR